MVLGVWSGKPEGEREDRYKERKIKKGGVKLYSGAGARPSWPAGNCAGHPATHRNSTGVLNKKELVKREKGR